MSDRTRALVMVFSLTHQLKEWINYSRSFGYMTQLFKHESNILSKQCDRFIGSFGIMDDDISDHSAMISELFEKLSALDEQDTKRVFGLIDKIIKTKNDVNIQTNTNRVQYLERSIN